MNALGMAALMAGMGAAKHFLIDEPAAEKQRKIEATKAMYSPWTGIQPKDVHDPNLGNTMLQGAMSGAMMGAQAEQQNLDNEFRKDYLAAMKGPEQISSPYMGMNPNSPSTYSMGNFNLPTYDDMSVYNNMGTGIQKLSI
jgi:hypothetical protein